MKYLVRVAQGAQHGVRNGVKGKSANPWPEENRFFQPFFAPLRLYVSALKKWNSPLPFKPNQAESSPIKVDKAKSSHPWRGERAVPGWVDDYAVDLDAKAQRRKDAKGIGGWRMAERRFQFPQRSTFCSQPFFASLRLCVFALKMWNLPLSIKPDQGKSSLIKVDKAKSSLSGRSQSANLMEGSLCIEVFKA